MSSNNSNIVNPGSNDILCGRGGGTNAHSGNIKFRKLVAAHKLRYLAASKSDKPGVARDVVREWRAMDPPGRFLAKMDKKEGGDDDDTPTMWYDVGDKKAREKASQCLRERNGAANEAVAALVKTVTASGEACPEDYATLMNKAAMVKAQNDLTIQQQNEMIKMGRQNGMSGNNGTGGNMGGSNNYCQEAFEPITINQPNRFPSGNNNFGGGSGNAEDDLIEAEIQRLLQQRQQQLMGNTQGGNSNGSGNGNSRNVSGGMGNMPQSTDFSGIPQPYMGEESVMREYKQLMLKQQELNVMAGKMNRGMGNNSSMNGGVNNSMNDMMNGMFNGSSMNSHMMSQVSGNFMSNSMGMNNLGNNNFGGQMSNQMQSNHNPDAAKDYMNRLRMLRQSGGGLGNGNSNGVPDQATSSSRFNNNGYSGNGGNMNNNNMGGGRGSDNMMNNMGNDTMNQMQGTTGIRGPEEFTIEEYQASLQQFLSHNDDFGSGGGSSASTANMLARGLSHLSGSTQNAGNLSSKQYNNNAVSGGVQCVQVATNLEDGNNTSRKQERRRSVDDMDLPLMRNTFKSIDSADRPSFQSMDDMDIRGTFRSVDTMDMMSIGNSINEIIDEDVKQNPESRKKYGRRLSSAGSRYGISIKAGGGNENAYNGEQGGPSLSDFAHLPGQTLEIRTMDHGNNRSSGGPKKIKKGRGSGVMIDPRLVAQAKAMTRHSVQTKDNDGPSSGGGRGSQLSIKDLNFDGVDDASRMSFGNMSVMSELTDFQEMMARGHADSFNQL
mmetsp:Transcript_44409/g.93241  ORF Transcript_44409/g.93241 Transcript_44409/m.93241 type:complete len:773 (-) Transcript_44409:285-2603(-)|eukprot:CAMPEP_0183725494 /NCGR_PEP_ID=MMETSP0737-20130205/20707_1 /TAXON_ID=385413 /ORGANISM="Thalassiosira miniscula, Strain CCMP1093" /LENGTH=772 /DNA_ID=CAMNT_0025956505 /DNA_START=80 /DNA_END=2398 /DNA_ORIENTATION=+